MESKLVDKELIPRYAFEKDSNQIKKYIVKFYAITLTRGIKQQLGTYTAVLIQPTTLDYVSLKGQFFDFLQRNVFDTTSNMGFIKLDRLLLLLESFFKTHQQQYVHDRSKSDMTDQIILYWSHLTGLKKILPLLLDKYVEEIFLSPTSQQITIDHFIFGRLRTNILISEKEKENILFRTAMENNLELNQINPSIKGDLQVAGLFSLRITGDINPFSYDGTIVNIRKLNQRTFTLDVLASLGTLDDKTSLFLKTLMKNGVNITIIGSPSSGKTTLQNALLRELPDFWRVFSFENTLETTIKADNFFRFKIYDFFKRQGASASTIINQILHRSPDYINLGEITTAEEALAWNACMSAGIPVIQTIHSNSYAGLLSRINNIFNISNDLLASSIPHIVVEIKYFWNNYKKERKLFTISEFVQKKDTSVVLDKIGSFDLVKKRFIWVKHPVHTHSFQWLRENKNSQIQNEFTSILANHQDI